MDYIEVSVEITPWNEDFSEVIVAEIEDLGFDSFVVEETVLKAYIDSENFSEPKLKTLLSAFRNSPDYKVSYTLNLIKYQNWNALWESSFEPVILDDLLTIKASFHKGLPKSRYNITIDPKMAFGTGHHNTTMLVAEAMMGVGYDRRKSIVRGKQVLDMGTGTGILAILAAKMGALVPVHAIDIDPIAVNSAKENARKNRVAHKIYTLCGDASLLQAGKYDLILANINRNILLEDISTYSRSMRSGGVLIMSGFFEADIDMLLEEGERYGLTFSDKRSKDNWACLIMVKK